MAQDTADAETADETPKRHPGLKALDKLVGTSSWHRLRSSRATPSRATSRSSATTAAPARQSRPTR
jgi:hypothetical protein